MTLKKIWYSRLERFTIPGLKLFLKCLHYISFSDAKKLLEADLGPNNEFYSLRGKCFDYTDREYVYTLCPFERATQKSKHGGMETSLGSVLYIKWIFQGQFYISNEYFRVNSIYQMNISGSILYIKWIFHGQFYISNEYFRVNSIYHMNISGSILYIKWIFQGQFYISNEYYCFVLPSKVHTNLLIFCQL